MIGLTAASVTLSLADAPKSTPPADPASAAPTPAATPAKPDPRDNQIAQLNQAMQILQNQRNQLAGQLMDVQLQLQLAQNALQVATAPKKP